MVNFFPQGNFTWKTLILDFFYFWLFFAHIFLRKLSIYVKVPNIFSPIKSLNTTTTKINVIKFIFVWLPQIREIIFHYISTTTKITEKNGKVQNNLNNVMENVRAFLGSILHILIKIFQEPRHLFQIVKCPSSAIICLFLESFTLVVFFIVVLVVVVKESTCNSRLFINNWIFGGSLSFICYHFSRKSRASNTFAPLPIHSINHNSPLYTHAIAHKKLYTTFIHHHLFFLGGAAIHPT